jgi:hypothetical protein
MPALPELFCLLLALYTLSDKSTDHAAAERRHPRCRRINVAA